MIAFIYFNVITVMNGAHTQQTSVNIQKNRNGVLSVLANIIHTVIVPMKEKGLPNALTAKAHMLQSPKSAQRQKVLPKK